MADDAGEADGVAAAASAQVGDAHRGPEADAPAAGARAADGLRRPALLPAAGRLMRPHLCGGHRLRRPRHARKRPHARVDVRGARLLMHPNTGPGTGTVGFLSWTVRACGKRREALVTVQLLYTFNAVTQRRQTKSCSPKTALPWATRVASSEARGAGQRPLRAAHRERRQAAPVSAQESRERDQDQKKLHRVVHSSEVTLLRPPLGSEVS